MSARHHMILVPGFGGFDALGELLYYSKVLDVLREKESPCVHFFPNLPMASVAARAEALVVWVGKRVERGIIQGDDQIHLVGHSTGGLDIRQMLAMLVETNRTEILEHVRSVQCISTPHRGTNLARWVGWLGPLFRCGATGAVRSMHCLGSHGTGALGRALRCLCRRGATPDWGDALIDALSDTCQCGTTGYKAAEARETYYHLLQWVENMARDTGAISDLMPPRVCGCSRESMQTPTQWPDDHRDRMLHALLTRDVRVRSIATVAQSRSSSCCDWLETFTFLHKVIGTCPPDSLSPSPYSGKLTILGTDVERSVGRADNDGIVNTVSMIWPNENETRLVEADHGDIIGHYPQVESEGSYDLLRSQPTFSKERFEDVWARVRCFAVNTSCQQKGGTQSGGGQTPSQGS